MRKGDRPSEERKKELIRIIFSFGNVGNDYDRPYEASIKGIMESMDVKRTAMIGYTQDLVDREMITFEKFHVRTKDGKIHEKSRFPILTKRGRDYALSIMEGKA